MIYRRIASPLHATRAGVAVAWVGSIIAAALVEPSPILLAALLVAVLGAGIAAGLRRPMTRAVRLAAVLAVTICLVNAIVTRDGLTTIWRFGDLPVLGQTDVTLEATVYGAVLGARAAILVLAGCLYSLAIDPDELLRLLRRVSFRSALTATIATRMVPVLLRDSRRLADAQRTRPGPPPGRAALMRASTAGVFDRALDVAATLEVRGYGIASRAPGRERALRRPWSRHDAAFLGSGAALLALVIGGRIAGAAAFSAYPVLRCAAGPVTFALAAAIVLAALLPFAARRGIAP